MGTVTLNELMARTGARRDVLLTMARETRRTPTRLAGGVCLFTPEDADYLVARYFEVHHDDIQRFSKPRRPNSAKLTSSLAV